MKKTFCYLPMNAPGEAFHYLDHLLPLAIELDLEIVTRSQKQYEIISQYYPKARQTLISQDEPLHYLQEPSVIISNAFRHQLEADLLYEKMLFGSFESIYCPHGLSDKELLFGKFQELDDDRKVLLYGKKMLQEVPSHCEPFLLGNYRKHHFERFASEYLSILQNKIPKWKPNRWTLLWAPSWVFNKIPGMTLPILTTLLETSLLANIPDDIQVLFKPHPYLLNQIPDTLEKIQRRAANSPNLLYLEDIPYIYPLFEKVDAYLGDTSSVGYDFLTTGKPIFSLSKNLDSPWQKLALSAPILNNGIDWKKLQAQQAQWDPSFSIPLLKQGFSEEDPLHSKKEAFFEYLFA